MSWKDEEVDLDMLLGAETPRAWLLHESEDDEEGVWLPKSQVSLSRTNRLSDGKQVVKVSMPAWLADEKGLV
jgi:hypothetical protein